MVSRAIIVLSLCVLGCDDPSASALKGQKNTKLLFLARVVDENGNGLSGVKLKYDLERIPKGWTFETRGRPHDHVPLEAVSDADGCFELQCDGHYLRLVEIEKEGYAHYFERRLGAGEGINNIAFSLNSFGDVLYRSNPANRTIYVMVSPQARALRMLPCRGGADSSNGTFWVENEPQAPLEPSIPALRLELPDGR